VPCVYYVFTIVYIKRELGTTPPYSSSSSYLVVASIIDRSRYNTRTSRRLLLLPALSSSSSPPCLWPHQVHASTPIVRIYTVCTYTYTVSNAEYYLYTYIYGTCGACRGAPAVPGRRQRWLAVLPRYRYPMRWHLREFRRHGQLVRGRRRIHPLHMLHPLASSTSRRPSIIDRRRPAARRPVFAVMCSFFLVAVASWIIIQCIVLGVLWSHGLFIPCLFV
jgi:hypothetical protein